MSHFLTNITALDRWRGGLSHEGGLFLRDKPSEWLAFRWWEKSDRQHTTAGPAEIGEVQQRLEGGSISGPPRPAPIRDNIERSGYSERNLKTASSRISNFPPY